MTKTRNTEMTVRTRSMGVLQTLRRDVPALIDTLDLKDAAGLHEWTQALDIKLLPKLQPDFPLVAAICGGGSAGKSTLFNSLIGHPVSPTGGRAGLNRRVLAALHPRQTTNAALLSALAHAFGTELHTMTDSAQLTTPGDPVYCLTEDGTPSVVLLDTPDIDTGARGAYANRELARQSLMGADIFIYIFTNATYNNRDNTDFIARLLTGIGTRPCFLVYRVYPSFSDEEVREHALTAATNIYGRDFEPNVLGIFRADDDNRVAAGQMPMALRAVTGSGRDLKEALAGLDARGLRSNLVRSMTADAVLQARHMAAAAAQAHDHLGRYHQALLAAQQQAVQQALSHFPTDQVLRRFADIWQATDPPHIKMMRRTGQVVEWPMKIVLAAVRTLRAKEKSSPRSRNSDDPSEQIALDLLQAATGLYQFASAGAFQEGSASLAAPAVVAPAQQALRQKDWQATLNRIQDQKEQILSWSGQLESDLRALALDLRQHMGLMDQLRQTFSALLNVIPATAAITYILHTGDMAGAVGIKVKLTGLLGINDLYALIAIPATAGLKRADQKQLAQLLAPVAQTWLSHKLTAVQNLLEEQISGDLRHTAEAALNRGSQLLEAVQRELSSLEEISL
ncbi:MAG: hypothetical protein M0036_09135 [Desulfobacteraceae bacterium]|nr:hypothetical protein [Desulfobacteraceae bacterium]